LICCIVRKIDFPIDTQVAPCSQHSHPIVAFFLRSSAFVKMKAKKNYAETNKKKLQYILSLSRFFLYFDLFVTGAWLCQRLRHVPLVVTGTWLCQRLRHVPLFVTRDCLCHLQPNQKPNAKPNPKPNLKPTTQLHSWSALSLRVARLLL